jgi:hypothetical protein
VGSDLLLSLLLSSRGMRGSSYGVYVHHIGEAGTPRIIKVPYLARQMSNWFYDTSTGTATRAAQCGSFVGDGLGPLDVSYREHGGDKRFTWFRPPERNTLCTWENESCIIVCCSSVGLALGCPEFSLSILTSTATFYSIRLKRLHCDLGPDRWPQGSWTPIPQGHPS